MDWTHRTIAQLFGRLQVVNSFSLEVLHLFIQIFVCAHKIMSCGNTGHASVYTIDFFPAFIDDPYVFGQIAANHALSDCHAMCAEAITALAICVVPFSLEDKVSPEHSFGSIDFN